MIKCDSSSQAGSRKVTTKDETSSSLRRSEAFDDLVKRGDRKMTGYTVHTGSSDKFSAGWDQIFAAGKAKKSKSKDAADDKKSEKSKSAKASSSKRKSSKKVKHGK
jgi:hypothetical protein